MQKGQGIHFYFISDKYVASVLFDEFNISFTLMAWSIYIYQRKVNGSRFPVQISGLNWCCVSFKYGPPLCWGTLRVLSKMLNRRHVRRLFMGFTSSWEGIWGGVGNLGKNKDTGNDMLKLIITEGKQGLIWGY